MFHFLFSNSPSTGSSYLGPLRKETTAYCLSFPTFAWGTYVQGRRHSRPSPTRRFCGTLKMFAYYAAFASLPPLYQLLCKILPRLIVQSVYSQGFRLRPLQSLDSAHALFVLQLYDRPLHVREMKPNRSVITADLTQARKSHG